MTKETVSTATKADDGMVTATVTKAGDGKIATGEEGNGYALNVYHKRGDKVQMPMEAALALEERAFVEID